MYFSQISDKPCSLFIMPGIKPAGSKFSLGPVNWKIFGMEPLKKGCDKNFYTGQHTQRDNGMTHCYHNWQWYMSVGYCVAEAIQWKKILLTHNICYRLSSCAFLVKLLSGECRKTLLMISQHCSGNGLVPPGTKPWPEPILTQVYVWLSLYGATMPQWVSVPNSC